MRHRQQAARIGNYSELNLRSIVAGACRNLRITANTQRADDFDGANE